MNLARNDLRKGISTPFDWPKKSILTIGPISPILKPEISEYKKDKKIEIKTTNQTFFKYLKSIFIENYSFNKTNFKIKNFIFNS